PILERTFLLWSLRGLLVFKQITGTAVPGRSTLKRPCQTGKGSGGKRDRGGSEKNADRKRRACCRRFYRRVRPPRSTHADIQESSKRRHIRRCLLSAGRVAVSRLRLVSALNAVAQRRSGEGINLAWKAQGMEPAMLDPFPGL